MVDFKKALQANNAVNAIMEDLKNRKGLENAWDSIDEDTQFEIISKWKTLIYRHIKDEK